MRDEAGVRSGSHEDDHAHQDDGGNNAERDRHGHVRVGLLAGRRLTGQGCEQTM